MKKCSFNSTGVKLSIDFYCGLLMWCESGVRKAASRFCRAEHLLSPLQAVHVKSYR